ncbi:DUF6578 domain-containing protein [Cellulomonas sp. S1-8]|uniref:DUF6578 domain-containing protein n=1 Tax=Cellulomonas sp. S1-8 TaxID=2904790 RepID=UPI0022446CF9|nr:DUF6578 domain-containing protein [Cellulomonas sp. S1-8]UZN03762.1 hypothetical protein OKX07_02120 [Cellulomonas sp. S1-8]
MSVLIWVDGWQMQCCGERFAVGEAIAWRCVAPDTEWLESTLGAVLARRVSAAEEHHDVLPDDHPTTHGTVVEIHAAFNRYAPLGADAVTRSAVPGSTVLRQVAHSGGDEDPPSDTHFDGWVVEVDLLPGRDALRRT